MISILLLAALSITDCPDGMTQAECIICEELFEEYGIPYPDCPCWNSGNDYRVEEGNFEYGACCTPSFCIDDVCREECELIQGSNFWSGYTCDQLDDNPDYGCLEDWSEDGVCCVEMECQWLPEYTCQSLGGDYYGDSITCATFNACPISTNTDYGKCCYFDDNKQPNCAVAKTYQQCLDIGGIEWVFGDDCDFAVCPNWNTYFENVCVETDDDDDDSDDDDPDDPEDPTNYGACCLGSICVVISEWGCNSSNGSFQGGDCTPDLCSTDDDEDDDPDDPDPPDPDVTLGACCIMTNGTTTCYTLDNNDCINQGGIYKGDNTVCSRDICNNYNDECICLLLELQLREQEKILEELLEQGISLDDIELILGTIEQTLSQDISQHLSALVVFNDLLVNNQLPSVLEKLDEIIEQFNTDGANDTIDTSVLPEVNIALHTTAIGGQPQSFVDENRDTLQSGVIDMLPDVEEYEFLTSRGSAPVFTVSADMLSIPMFGTVIPNDFSFDFAFLEHEVYPDVSYQRIIHWWFMFWAGYGGLRLILLQLQRR